jgi:uncharacterized protein involved in outer membrane biogenesis
MSMVVQAQESTPPSTSRRRWRRWALALAACVALYAVLGFWVAPRLVEHYVPIHAQDSLKRKAQLGRVRINPFLLTIEAKDFKLEEMDGAPIAAFGRLFVDLELKSLLRWAWTVAQIRLEQPALDLVLDADGSLNLARLADDLADPAPATTEPLTPPPRAILQRIVVSGGRISLTDRSTAAPARMDITPLDVELNDISTLPGRKGPYRLRATLPGGGAVEWDGEISLHPIASTGQLRAKGVKLATAWKLLRDRLALGAPTGTLDAELGYQFGYGRDGLLLKVDPLKVQLNGLRLAFADAAASILELESLRLEGARFDLAAREFVIPKLSVSGARARVGVDRQGVLDWQKVVRRGAADGAQDAAKAPTSGPGAPWKLRIDEATVDSVGLRYRDASRAAPTEVNAASAGARFALAAQLDGGKDPAVALSGLNVELSAVTGGAAGDAPLLRFDRVALEDASIDVGARTIRLPRVVVRGGATQIVRAADGGVRGINVLDPADEGKIQREVIAAGRRAAEEGKPWAFSLERLVFEQFHASYRDETTQPPLALGIKDLTAELRDISNDPKAVVSYDAKLVLAHEGRVTAAGRFALAGDSADSRLALESISLQPLAPLVSKLTVLRLESGDVSGQAQITFRNKGEHPTLAAEGAVTVAGLLLKEADSKERFLAWKSFEAKGLRYNSDPARIDVQEVMLREPGAKIVVFKDRSVNLAKVLKDDAAKPAPSAAPSQSAVNPTAISVGRVRVINGAVDFADLSLVLPFATKVHKLRGSASRISSDPKSRTTLKFEGGVGQFGDVRVDGQLAPFQPKAFTDINVAFRNVEMTTLSPYTATFAGRKIASGRLDLGLQYKIENDALKGSNTVLLRDFTLGEQVDSPDAKDLPLDLAVALLKDGEGKIDLAIPVEGDIDNPEFNIGGVVMSAIGNVIGKLVSAPFRALGAAFGGSDGDAADSVSFDPGRSALAPPAQEKLKKLAVALAKRPELQLTLHGGVDPAVDGRAINARALRAALAKKLGVTLETGEDPGQVSFGDAKTQRALEALAIERGGEGAVDAFQKTFEKSAGRSAQRVNPALALLGQGSEDDVFYRALFDDLVRIAPRPDAGLAQLAAQRGAALKRRLTEGTSLSAARVAIGKAEPSSATKAGVPSRLALGALARAR